MAKCIRCEQKVRLGTDEGQCPKAPDRGPHETPVHDFVPGRLDGLCGAVDPDSGVACGRARDDEVNHWPVGVGPVHGLRAPA